MGRVAGKPGGCQNVDMDRTDVFQLFPDLFVKVYASDRGITAIYMSAQPFADQPQGPAEIPGPLGQAKIQLREYAAGERRVFEVPLDLRGTPFQLAVWNRLLEIPYGETRTYKEIALLLDKPLAVRAVGTANGANPVPIIVPCHRVVASGGGLGGYSAGLHIKERLLRLEGASPEPGQKEFLFS